jgi:PAS domain S-box-containing protein
MIEPANDQERDLLQFLLENIPDRIYFKDKESRFIRVSRALSDLFGAKSPRDVVGRTDFDFFTREHAQPAFDDEQLIIRSGRPIIGKVEKETLPDGSIGWAITTKMPLRDSHGEIVGTCGISKDFSRQKGLEDALAESNNKLQDRQTKLQQALTELNKTLEELKETQQQLVAAEKMQTVGRLAYGVAHELRNPLSILNMGMEFLANEPALAGNEACAAILGEMRTGIRRADAVISALMESSSGGSFNFEACHIQIPIKQALAAIDGEARHRGIRVNTDFAAGLPPLKIDCSKIEQVLDGVFSNAVDAMPSGGELSVRTLSRQLTDTEIARDPGLRSGNRFRTGETVAVIEIDDTGAGIPKEVLPKIFDPFFTTKETGAGAGMGLTICQKIIELHQGILQVSNRDKGGVRVTILFKMTPAV